MMPLKYHFPTRIMAVLSFGVSISKSLSLVATRQRVVAASSRSFSLVATRPRGVVASPLLCNRASFQTQRSRQGSLQLFSTMNSNVEISPTTHGTKKLDALTQGVDPALANVLQQKKLINPTPIQAHAIPLLYKGYDVMAAAQTGSGKTLMFSLPLIQKLLRNPTRRRSKSPSAIVLNPTRELAIQTAKVINELIKGTSLQVSLATGGANVGRQRRELSTCDILVGTPGRILQFVDERVLSLQETTDVVVDEGDRMLDLGFEPQLKRIARALKAHDKRTVLCSATFPLDVQHVASEFLRQDYYFVAVGRVGGTNERIKQKVLWVDGGPQARRKRVIQEINNFLKQNKKQRIIVFCNTKEEAERVGSSLEGKSVRVVTGDKMQKERNQALQGFRDGTIQILVATDIAARGLDVPDVGLVLQADAPRDSDTFVHRVGRTGRAGARGNAIAILNERSTGIAMDLVEMLQEAKQPVPVWLTGMAHVSRARRLEEERLIIKGGGTNERDRAASADDGLVDPASNDGFTVQDFRRNAELGTWGSERDISYKSFDDDAYTTLEDIDLTTLQTDDTDSIAGAARLKSSEPADAEEGPAWLNQSVSPSFSYQKPSQQLSEALKRISDVDNSTENPNRKVLASLRNSNSQRLRFEYIGMFPFDVIRPFLTSGSPDSRERTNSSDQKMPRLLMVAEKPSIAEAIANALSGSRGPRKRRGISRALPVYQFTAKANLPGQANKSGSKSQLCSITVTSVVGHVFSLGFDQENMNGDRRHADPIEYFSMPVVKQEEGSTGKLRVVEHLKALAGDCDHLVLWLDCDAEGENIAHEVMGIARKALEQKVAEEKLRNADSDAASRRIHRARFSAITQEALRHAFANLVEPDSALSRSVDARQELDLRVGVSLTRLLNWRCVGYARKRFSPTTKLVSYGPCQTPALSFCVDRSREIEAFKPEKYWKVDVSIRSKNSKASKYQPKWQPARESMVGKREGSKGKGGSAFEDCATYNEQLAKRVVQRLSSPTVELEIARVESVAETINAPLGLNTVALLSAGSKAMGMSPKQVMNVAEKLYSAGFISYPRTETTRYDPSGFDVRSVLKEHVSHPEWGRTSSHLLKTKYQNSGRPPTRGHDAGDHPPITCLKPATREEVGGGAAWRVYDFVARNFLGSLGDELRFTRRVAELKMNDGKTRNDDGSHIPSFLLEQVSVDSLGFAGACRWVLRDIGAPSKDDTVAPFEKGMRFDVEGARCEATFTRPPKFLQEHELIELMDANRIGTDASMAGHVNNIVDRQYVVICDESGVPLRPPSPPRPGRPRPPRQVGRYLVPTSLGIGLVDLFGRSSESEIAMTVDMVNGGSPVLLTRPRIRALMEEEVRTIATGKLDKNECLDKNLAWFEARYHEFESLLTRRRLELFSKSLEPVKSSLSYWRQMNVFEPVPQTQQKRSGSKHRATHKAPRRRTAKHGPPRRIRDTTRSAKATTRRGSR